MTITNDLNLKEMTQGQNSKYVTQNESNRQVAASVGGTVVLDFTSDANMVVNSSDNDGDEHWRYKFIELTDTGTNLTTGRDVELPAKGPVHIITNSTAQTLTIKINGQTGTAITTTNSASLWYDGTDWVAVP